MTTTLSTDAFTANGATITVTATSGPLTNTDTTTVTGGVTLELTTTPAIAESQTGGINAGRANTVTATLKNAGGTGISGQTITFGVTGISGTYSAATATTDASGVASVTLTPDTWTAPGTTATLTATTGPATTTTAPITLGANALAAGYNAKGCLGDGTTTSRSSLTQPLTVFPSPITQIASGGLRGSATHFTLFLLEDKTVWSVGGNESGQLGLADTTDRLVPTLVPGLANVKQLAAGNDTSYAVTHDGAVFGWGFNNDYGVGDGTNVNRLVPTQVSGLEAGIDQIAAHTGGGYALTKSGALKAWGSNNSGRVGDGSGVGQPVPVAVAALDSVVVKKVVAGADSGYALTTDGDVYSWGANNLGQLGDGTQINKATPSKIADLSLIDDIAAGSRTVYATDGSHQVLAWGGNNFSYSGVPVIGTIGDGTAVDRSLPTPITVGGGANVTSVAPHAATTFAYVSQTEVYAWGDNAVGQYGNGDTTGVATPTAAALTLPAGRRIAGLSTYSMSTFSTFLITVP